MANAQVLTLGVEDVVQLLHKVLDLVHLDLHDCAREAVLTKVGPGFARSQLKSRAQCAIKRQQMKQLDQSATHTDSK